jgi:hypothetical protein
MPQPLPDLSLVPTNDLINAVCLRFDYAVFHGIIDRHAPSADEDGQQIVAMVHVGDPYTCIGMAAAVQHRILNDLTQRTIKTDRSNL